MRRSDGFSEGQITDISRDSTKMRLSDALMRKRQPRSLIPTTPHGCKKAPNPQNNPPHMMLAHSELTSEVQPEADIGAVGAGFESSVDTSWATMIDS